MCGYKLWYVVAPGDERLLTDRHAQLLADLRLLYPHSDSLAPSGSTLLPFTSSHLRIILRNCYSFLVTFSHGYLEWEQLRCERLDCSADSNRVAAASELDSRFPEWRRACVWRLVQRPGETLFVPSGWHHQVINLVCTFVLHCITVRFFPQTLVTVRVHVLADDSALCEPQLDQPVQSASLVGVHARLAASGRTRARRLRRLDGCARVAGAMSGSYCLFTDLLLE